MNCVAEPVDDGKKLRGATTPPTALPPPPLFDAGTSPNNFSLRKRTTEDIEEAADLLGISFDEAAAMNSKDIERCQEIKRPIVKARTTIQQCMAKQGVTSAELSLVLEEVRPNLRAGDSVIHLAERGIIRLRAEEGREHARSIVREWIARDDITPAELTEVVMKWKVAGNLSEDDPILGEADDRIAKLYAYEQLRQCLRDVEASSADPLEQADVLAEMLGAEKVALHLGDDDPVVEEVKTAIANYQNLVARAQSKNRGSLTMDSTSRTLNEVLVQKKTTGRLKDTDPAIWEAKVKLAEVNAREDAARTSIRKGVAEARTSVKLNRLLTKEIEAGRLYDDDPAVCEAKDRIAQLEYDENN
jgi:hypothetical protein